MRKIAILLVVLMGMTACGGNTVTTVTEASKSQSSTSVQNQAVAVSGSTNKFVSGNLPDDYWYFVADQIIEGEFDPMCDGMEVLYADSIIHEFRSGFNSVGGPSMVMTETESMVILMSVVAIRCPWNNQMLLDELFLFYSQGEIGRAADMFDRFTEMVFSD